MNRWMIGSLLCVALALSPGCKKDETAGEALDRGIDNTKEATKKAADKTGEALKDAGDKVKDASK
jgi:hypothetical protein